MTQTDQNIYLSWAWEFSLFEESLSFEAQDPNVEQYPKIVAVIQSTTQGYHVIYSKMCSWTGRIHIVKMTILLKEICNLMQFLSNYQWHFSQN